MKYDRIPQELFIKNREKFVKNMKENTLAVFNSNDIYPVSADSTLPFAQHRDIFYLTGADQEESILVLFPDASDEKHREILFLRETSEHIAIWEGEKLTKEAAFEVSGIKTVYWTHQFEMIFRQLMAEAEGIYLNTNEHLRHSVEMETREDRFIKKVKAQYPAHQVYKSAPILHRIRSVKEKEELDLMQTACDITKKGFERVLKFTRSGVWEYELEAEFIHEFIRNRSKGFAYTPIIASGASACVLHYIENNKQCKDGDVILLDVAAEYANYSSDLSRSIPVNGRFTDRQKEVYNAVLHVKKEAEKLLVPGIILAEYQKEVGRIMEAELIKLKLIDSTDIKNQDPNWPAYKKYFMHGTSHFLGLDTHDVGLWNEPIKANMVFTCEPGIYIREEGLGIRIEDNLVIREDGPAFNLMRDIPIEADHIEEIMNSK
ncbi:MAG: aminopeptidase P N-terminal domain-containing protein [Flavobacteriia bacterium]|nr:aminopeptidase P N-terminal domain-containing protein [Flavobacteriia bacterium]OJX39837.1 MAG: X-Pro aminopeptidase [Flavobacteriia bacterium 40-80]